MKRLLLIVSLALAAPAAAQRAGVETQAAIVPDSLTVGTVVHAAIRVRAPAGVRIEFPDTLGMAADAENAGVPTMSRDSSNGTITVTAAYPVTSWRPGRLQLPPATVRLVSDAGVDSVEVRFQEIDVVSVLPPDTAGIQPRPARDVMGGVRVWWPLLVALLVALALAALALWAWRRRRREAPDMVPAPATPPRETALALLDRVRTLRLIENGEIRRAYILISEAVRGYLESVDPAWGMDLTTTELRAMLAVSGVDGDPALRVLDHADLVKFAKMRIDADTAQRDLIRSREWVAGFAEPHAQAPVLVGEEA